MCYKGTDTLQFAYTPRSLVNSYIANGFTCDTFSLEWSQILNSTNSNAVHFCGGPLYNPAMKGDSCGLIEP